MGYNVMYFYFFQFFQNYLFLFSSIYAEEGGDTNWEIDLSFKIVIRCRKHIFSQIKELPKIWMLIFVLLHFHIIPCSALYRNLATGNCACDKLRRPCLALHGGEWTLEICLLQLGQLYPVPWGCDVYKD